MSGPIFTLQCYYNKVPLGIQESKAKYFQTPIISYNCMLSHQRAEQFEKDWGCVLVGGSVSQGVGFEVSKVHVRPSVSLFACCLWIRM